MKILNIKLVKGIITILFLLGSAWVTFLVFEREFARKVLVHTADANSYENTLLILLIGTIFSIIGIFCMGVMSLFTRFVFVKLIFADEIREAAYLYYINKRRENKKEIENIKTNPINPLVEEENTEIVQINS